MSFHGLVGESWTSIAKHGSEKISRRSVKETMGRAVLLCCPTWCCSFQNLLVGDGVASTVEARIREHWIKGFSPLLDGDGVASVGSALKVTLVPGFSAHRNSLRVLS